MSRAERDSDRSRRLLFAPELGDGTLRLRDLAAAEVRHATLTRRVPAGLTRRYQQRLMRRGSLTYEGETVERAMAARRAVLGRLAEGPPRLVVRIGALPGAGGLDALRRVHDVLAEAGLPYLVAVPPDPDAPQREAVAELRRDGVAFAMHGGRAGRDLTGLGKDALAAELDRAEAQLADAAIRPDVFVAPSDRFAWRQWEVLSKRWSVVAGGPASVGEMGYHDTPLWRGEAVWMPAYPPFHGSAAAALEGARRMAERGAALWVPVALDWEAEVRAGLEDLRRFARDAAGWTADWDAFLEAVRMSRAGS